MRTPIITLILLFWSSLFAFSKPSLNTVNFKPKIKEFTLPFHLVNKLIVLEATVNDEKGWFILDTGVPDLILNKTHFSQKGKRVSFTEIGGEGMAAYKLIVDFQLGKTKPKTDEFIALDLSHLERKTKIPIKGMIGQKLLRNYEILLDYEQKTITFFRLNRRGIKLATTLMPEYPASDTIRFTWKGHLPTVKVAWGGQSLRFGLDTGAGINLVAENKAKLLVAPSVKIVKVKLLNMGKGKKSLQRKVINMAKIGKSKLLPMQAIKCHFGAINANLAGKKLDGMLGYEFLKQQKVAINFKKRTLYLWPNTMIHQQILVERAVN